MSAAAWTTFALIAGFIWGGFITLVALALRKERSKDADGAERGLWVP